MDGFISYPRTDNTVYPQSLEHARAGPADGPDSGVRGRRLRPRRRRWRRPAARRRPPTTRRSTRRRRFTRARSRVPSAASTSWSSAASSPPSRPPMITESTRADIEAGTESYFVRGSVVVDAGFAKIYTYARSSDDEIPKLEAGQELALDGDPWSVGKETQPPSRISQGKLIELMEERGLGTKATRADIIQKLYDRGYVYSNPPIPSETGIAMYKAFKEYVPRMATPEMTAELERGHGQDRRGRDDQGRRPGREPRDAPRHDEGNAGPVRRPRQGGVGGHGRGQVPRPVRGLHRGRAHRPRGRLAEPPARDRHARRQALLGLRGLQPRRSRSTRTRAATRGRCPAAATSSGASRRAARSARSARASPSRASAAARGSFA